MFASSSSSSSCRSCAFCCFVRLRIRCWSSVLKHVAVINEKNVWLWEASKFVSFFSLFFFGTRNTRNTRNSVAAVVLIFLLAVVSSWHKATSMCEYCHWPQNLSQLEILCCCRKTTTTTLTKSLIKDNMSFRFSDGLFFHCRSPSHFRFTLSHVVDKHKVWRRESTQKTFFFCSLCHQLQVNDDLQQNDWSEERQFQLGNHEKSVIRVTSFCSLPVTS